MFTDRHRKRELQVADAAQLFGDLLHYRIGHPSQGSKQVAPIDRSRLIDHNLAGS
jgi:hypothetical protein